MYCFPYIKTADRLPKSEGWYHNLIVVTQTGMVLIYDELKLVWGARSQNEPISLQIGTFK